MKGCLAAGTFAVKALRKAGVSLKGGVTFHNVIGEESGGIGTLVALNRAYNAEGADIF